MTITVSIPQSLGGSNSPYNDGVGSFGFAGNNGFGYKTYLLPMLSEIILACQAAVLAGNTAVNAPGSAGTSTTSLTIGVGAQTFTTQTGKAWQVGQTVVIAITATPTSWMAGPITAYNSGTGAMTVQTTQASGSGTATAWTISLSGPVSQTPSATNNRAINGSCLIAQQAPFSIAAPAVTYGGCDQYITAVTATTVSGTINQAASAPYSSGFCHVVSVTTTGATVIGFSKPCESIHVNDMNSKTVTLRLRVHQSSGATLTFTPTISKANTVDNFGVTTPLASGAAVSVPGNGTVVDAIVTTTLGATDASNGILIGGSFSSSAAVTGVTFGTGDWWFDIGATMPANAPERINASLEFLRCARYFYAPVNAICGVQFSTSAAAFPVAFPVPMRIAPSFAAVATTTTMLSGGTSSGIPGTWGPVSGGTKGSIVQFTRTTGTWTIGQAILVNDASAASPFTFSARL